MSDDERLAGRALRGSHLCPAEIPAESAPAAIAGESRSEPSSCFLDMVPVAAGRDQTKSSIRG